MPAWVFIVGGVLLVVAANALYGRILFRLNKERRQSDQFSYLSCGPVSGFRMFSEYRKHLQRSRLLEAAIVCLVSGSVLFLSGLGFLAAV